MKNIIECSDDYLMLELPINRAVSVDLSYPPEEKKEHIGYYDDSEYRFEYNEYITWTSKGYQRLLKFISTECVIHGNCPVCKVPTHFTVKKGCELEEQMLSPILCTYTEQFDGEYEYIPDPDIEMIKRANDLLMKTKLFDKKFLCPKCEEIFQSSFALEFNKTENKIDLIKVGQYPSLQEFAVVDFKGFNKVLDALAIKTDYRNAIRNHIDGDNIAAYVYLRRIVEKIIMDSFKNNKDELNISNEDFEKLRTKDKISKLKNYLPKFLFDNKEIYSIVSAGIHSLSEKQCKEYYDVIKDAIDIILHQEEARRKENEMMKKTVKGLQIAVSEIDK